MTASEMAFLALGLLLGTAVGAALIVTFGLRAPRREIRVTVTRDALPRRSDTLSQGAFATRPSEPARGGPGDRRWFDRDHATPESPAVTTTMTWPVQAAAESPDRPPRAPSTGAPNRTIVPLVGGQVTAAALASASSPAPPVGIPIEPERDPELEELRTRPGRGSTLERMLRGEHLAMVEAVDAIAGEDGPRRRDWEVLLGGLVEAMADVAVQESVIDFPMGTAFWDAFTVEQCRRIVGALASMGYRYDGVAGWSDSRVPAYRDLTQALADVGIEPRRVRAWPNQAEIAMLFVGARPAPEELLAAAGPDYGALDMQALIGERAVALADLWIAWDSVRAGLVSESLAFPAHVESHPVA